MYYLNILKEQIKLSFMSVAIFRANFVLMLLQSITNSVLGILCVEFIYIHVDSIAGWSQNEMIILYCTSIIVNQIYRGLINPNHMRFIGSISSGGFDRMLVKPVNVIFQINTGSIDYSSLLSLIAPIVVMCLKINALDISITGFNVLLFLIFLANAVIILTSFMMLLYSLAFKYIKVHGLTGIYFILMSMSEKPKEIFSYNGFHTIVDIAPYTSPNIYMFPFMVGFGLYVMLITALYISPEDSRVSDYDLLKGLAVFGPCGGQQGHLSGNSTGVFIFHGLEIILLIGIHSDPPLTMFPKCYESRSASDKIGIHPYKSGQYPLFIYIV